MMCKQSIYYDEQTLFAASKHAWKLILFIFPVDTIQSIFAFLIINFADNDRYKILN
jgi:hypothetical protein